MPPAVKPASPFLIRQRSPFIIFALRYFFHSYACVDFPVPLGAQNSTESPSCSIYEA